MTFFFVRTSSKTFSFLSKGSQKRANDRSQTLWGTYFFDFAKNVIANSWERHDTPNPFGKMAKIEKYLKFFFLGNFLDEKRVFSKVTLNARKRGLSDF